MNKDFLMLTPKEANAPKPQPPNNINPQAWIYYYEDLACWIATKAEAWLSGIKEETK